MVSLDIINRVKSATLWSKNVYFDMFVTKWAGLWQEDVISLVELAEQIQKKPATINEYRKWLNGR